jgi:hypothetical protein
MRRWIPAVSVALLMLGATTFVRAQSARELARSVAQAQAYASLAPVPRNRTFEIAVVAKIKPTFHINAHKVLDEFMIPTNVEAKLPPGFRLVSADYPAGELRQFSFSKKKLAVYTGQVKVLLKVEAERHAPLGPQDLSLAFHYQACNDAMCLPPVNVPVTLHLTVARAGSHAKPLHPELFRH